VSLKPDAVPTVVPHDKPSSTQSLFATVLAINTGEQCLSHKQSDEEVSITVEKNSI